MSDIMRTKTKSTYTWEIKERAIEIFQNELKEFPVEILDIVYRLLYYNANLTLEQQERIEELFKELNV